MKRILATVVALAAVVTLIALGRGETAAADGLDRLDFVNIGSPASETGHSPVGWGPEEPTTHGGGWGGIGTCGVGHDGVTPTGPDCDGKTRVIWTSTTTASATVTFAASPDKPVHVRFRHLDGAADDSFKVEVMDKDGAFREIFVYTGENDSTEDWHVNGVKLDKDTSGNHIRLPKSGGGIKGPVVLKFTATGSQWSGWGTYGQVAFDWVELLGKAK